SDRVAVMNGGRFEQIGTPQELYHRPASAFVAGFVGDSNRWSGRVAAVARDGVRVETDEGADLLCQAGQDGLAAGDPVDVFVRPEAIVLDGRGEWPEAGRNRLEGCVDSLLFNGAASRLLVRAGDGRLVE